MARSLTEQAVSSHARARLTATRRNIANTIQAAETLCVDEEFRKQLAAARARRAPNQIGSAGQLQAWLDDRDMKAGDLHHRHVSHFYGLYPGREITLRGTPDLAAAVRKSREIRGDKAIGRATATVRS